MREENLRKVGLCGDKVDVDVGLMVRVTNDGFIEVDTPMSTLSLRSPRATLATAC